MCIHQRDGHLMDIKEILRMKTINILCKISLIGFNWGLTLDVVIIMYRMYFLNIF